MTPTARRPVDVAMFLPFFGGGGAERVMIDLANAFAARGVEVDFIVCRNTGPLKPDFHRRIRLHQLRVNQAMLASPELAGYLRRTQPSSFLSTLIHANVAACVGHQLAGSRARLLLRIETTLTTYYRQASLPVRLALRLAPLVFPRADKIVAISDAVRDDVSRMCPSISDRVMTIHNPVDLARVGRLAADPAPHPWLEEQHTPVIMGVGRLVPEKDFATLIRAFSILRGSRRCRLIILGEGFARPQLERLAADLNLADDVLMPGFVTNPYPWIARAALFVLTSRVEGFGNVLTEALACAVPVVASDCPGGPREILDGGMFGTLVPVGDAEGFAAAMAVALSSEPQREQLRSRAADFEISSVADRYLTALLS